MFFASMDNKTAFDVAKQRHIAKIMDGQDSWVYCGRPTLEMINVEGKASFESVECFHPFTRCI